MAVFHGQTQGPYEFVQPDVFERKLDRALRNTFSEPFYHRKASRMWSADEAALWSHFAARESTNVGRRPNEVPSYWAAILYSMLDRTSQRTSPNLRRQLHRGLELATGNLQIQVFFCI